MTEPVALEAIRSCFRGVIPSPLATCAADGTPNITYLSIVQYVDSERIALSRQFFNKTRANLDANPFSQVRVVDPGTLDQYELDLEFLHTEAQGPTFETMRTNLAAIASQTGMADTFRLRGVDIHRVLRCAAVGGTVDARPRPRTRDPLVLLDELTRRLSLSDDYDEATRAALHALDDVFEFRHAILLVRDPDADRLYAVAENGYPDSAAGAEVPLGEGVIGTAAASAQVVSIPNLARARVMQAAVRDADSPADEIPLPGLPGALSVAAVPLVAHGAVTGVLYLESEQVGAFGPHNERLLSILGRHLAAALRGFGQEPAAPTSDAQAAAPAQTGRALQVTYYQADDSVFVDDRYVVKGVPGRILWKLVREHATAGRETFTNRELRLDETLGLPAGADNLEARLLVLRKRLARESFGLHLERVARGRLALRTAHPLVLSEVETRGPMRAAHRPRGE